MLRYITAAIIAGLLLTVAVKARDGKGAPADSGDTEATTVLDEKPDVKVSPVPGGVDLKVSHRFASSVSRASLVYKLEGRERLLDKTTNCQAALDKKTQDGYTSVVSLGGRLPTGAKDLRLVVEDETGTKVLPVSLD